MVVGISEPANWSVIQLDFDVISIQHLFHQSLEWFPPGKKQHPSSDDHGLAEHDSPTFEEISSVFLGDDPIFD